jgi:hypothetical protein
MSVMHKINCSRIKMVKLRTKFCNSGSKLNCRYSLLTYSHDNPITANKRICPMGAPTSEKVSISLPMWAEAKKVITDNIQGY